MPSSLTYPGVYVEEISSGVHSITGVATSIAAFVGYTTKGPLNEAVVILNFSDFERTFGGLSPDSEVAYAVQQFFLNGGSEAYVVRVADGAATAQVTLRDASNDAALVVSAASPGAWGNNVRLDVDYATLNPDSSFNLRVRRYELQGVTMVAVAKEDHLNLSMNSRSPNYALSVVNDASKMVQLALPTGGLTLDSTVTADRGFSLSRSLATFPSLTTQNRIVSGTLDGTTPFTLLITDPTMPTDLDDLVTSLTNAIAAAGLTSRLVAERANTAGGASSTGVCLKLRSVYLTTNLSTQTNTKTEFSSVQISSAPTNDGARVLKLGLNNGGREKEGASACRPPQCGTTSSDLADLIGTAVTGVLTVTVNDNSSGSPVALLSAAPTASIPNTLLNGPAISAAVKSALQALNLPAAANATVELNGNFLRIVSGTLTPNASIIVANSGIGTSTNLRLSGGTSIANVQQYSLGGGAAFKAQINAIPGADGTVPSAALIIGDYGAKTGLYALRDVDLFNLLLIPRTAQMSSTEANSVYAAALTFCEERRAFYLLDPDQTSKTISTIGAWLSNTNATSRNGAVYYPEVRVADPLNGFRLATFPASGTVAGVFARTDSERGVWKAPAGVDATLRGVQDLVDNLTDGENGLVNPLGINCLRTFPIYGRVIWGSRTLRGSDQAADDYKYVPVRRFALFLEESLYRGSKWVVFEPNDEPLWAQIRLNIGAFLHTLFRQGAFQGASPKDAYFVKCDRETTTQDDINHGIVNIVVGFAPLKPAEFVIIKLQQIAGQIQT